MAQESGPQEDIGWQHGKIIDAQRRRVKCKWCGKEMNGCAYRLKQHIAGMREDVKSCEIYPKESRDEMRAYMTGKKVLKDFRAEQEVELQEEISGHTTRRREKGLLRERSNQGDDSDNPDNDDDDDKDDELRAARRESLRSLAEDEERQRGAATSGGSGTPSDASFPRSSSGISLPKTTSLRRVASVIGCRGTIGDVEDPMRGTIDHYLYRKRTSKQKTIKQAMRGVKVTAETTSHAFKYIVKWFLHVGVPAHTTFSLYFQTMLDAVADAAPGIKAPTPRDIYETGLDGEVAELRK